MGLETVTIKNCRNIIQANIHPTPNINIIHGENGSGKTSVLEAIHLLGLAKSFRTTDTRKIINDQAERYIIFGELNTGTQYLTIGVDRDRKEMRVKVSGEPIKKISQLRIINPIQVINTNSNEILEMGPKLRRNVLDWGVFHVEQIYLGAWKDYHRILKQRNASLRGDQRDVTIRAWNTGMIEAAAVIHNLRAAYIRNIAPIFNKMAIALLGERKFDLLYRPGWKEGKCYQEVLESNLVVDRSHNHTVYGPHRADFAVLIDGRSSRDKISRGQQRLLIAALKLAQLQLIQNATGRQCVVLVDDLPAELDKAGRDRLIGLIGTLPAQAFITAIDERMLSTRGLGEVKMFHVEHGNIRHVG